jgi:glutathione S-transferase
MTQIVLHIGNKRYSSWSMRPWLALRKAGIGFEENVIPLDLATTRAALDGLSPGGTVPVLQTSDAVIWDSLAICEWAAEQNASLWPRDPGIRGRARSAAAMMHSGFFALRTQCPMDIGRPASEIELDGETRSDIAKIEALWADVRCGDGPFLFGEWSIADAFFTPVAVRFAAFKIALSPSAQAYCDALLADESFLAWKAGADAEHWIIDYDPV